MFNFSQAEISAYANSSFVSMHTTAVLLTALVFLFAFAWIIIKGVNTVCAKSNMKSLYMARIPIAILLIATVLFMGSYLYVVLY